MSYTQKKEVFMPAQKLKDFLDENEIQYITITHSQAYTAQKVAASAHISGWEIAKTVIVKVDGELAMAVLPASTRIDMRVLKEVTGFENVQLATEDEFSSRFHDCETGAMPPFGNLYGMDVYVANSLAEDEEIAFNACSHTELVRMSYYDYARLVHPKVLEFAYY